MGFLIPAAQPNPGFLTRFGRLVHWTALGSAALTLLVPTYFAAVQSADLREVPVAQLTTGRPAPKEDCPHDGWEAFCGSAYAAQDAAESMGPSPASPQKGLPYAIWPTLAVAIALIGRAARYLFAGE